MQRRAFTLIELLVVIAIIAILAAILFPVFAQAKLAAKKTTALSNAKQLATAAHIYMGDSDDALPKSYYGFPDACNWGNGNTTYYNWRYALNPYHKSQDLLTDATNPFQGKKGTELGMRKMYESAGQPTLYSSQNWAVNGHIIGFGNGNCAGLPTGLGSVTSLEDVAGTIMIAPNRSRWHDLRMFFMSATNSDHPNWCLPANPADDSGTLTCPTAGNGPVHAVGKQAAFVWSDGHAKAMAPLATLRTSEVNFDNWYGYNGDQAGGVKYTQADRQGFAANAYKEYK